MKKLLLVFLSLICTFLLLPEENSYAKSAPFKGYIALTFDDGPGAGTASILRTLGQQKIPATFFMVGQSSKQYPQLARQVALHGHEIGHHTYSHANLTSITQSRIKTQINSGYYTVKKYAGKAPTVFRPPYGNFNYSTLKYSKVPVILWNVDTLDWKVPTAASMNMYINQQVRPGSIILMHDSHATTANNLPAVIYNLRAQGYRFTTVSHLLHLNKHSKRGPYYGNYSA
ncbi:polysaccharide deacetylase family protein [Macrococcus equi]|uniref:polysaccharide deacetylase family protein n=1 Tax=Macrococcus equi TaxID=3395462 RepID=UPI0039BDDA7F